MNIENHEIKVFKAIIEENGFKKAAKKLFISQSAVSQSLSNLERKLEAKLLTRSPLSLTESGKRLLTYAYSVLKEEEAVLDDLYKIEKGIHSTLSLVTNNSTNQFYAADLIYQFCQENPLTRLKVDVLPSREIIYAVLAEKWELGFGPFQKQMSAYETIPLFQEERYLVVSQKHPLYQELMKRPKKTLKNIPLLTSYIDESDLRPSKEKLRDSFQTLWEVSSNSLRLKLVNQGLGVTYVEQKIFQENPLCKDFTLLNSFSFSKIQRQAGIYYKKEKPLSEGAQKFIKLCESYF